MRTKASDRHIVELDGLRGLAVIMVLVWHFTGSRVISSWGPGPAALQAWTMFGRAGVDLFFVLSGFLIIGILIDNRGASNFLSTFYLRRAARILPPYFALMAVYWLCFVVLGSSSSFNTEPYFWLQFAAQITFTFNILMAFYDGAVARAFSVVWSVNIEEWFYLVFPLLVLITPVKKLPYVLVGMGLLSALGRAAVHLKWPDLWQAPYVLPPLRMDGLCIGGLIAFCFRREAIMSRLRRHRQAFGFGAVVFLGALPAVIAAISSNLPQNMYLWGHLYLAFGFGVVLLAILLNEGGRITTPFRSSALKLAGKHSYSLYLFHPLFLSVFFVTAGRAPQMATWFDSFLVAGALVSTLVFVAAFYPLESWLRSKGRKVAYISEPASSARLVVSAS